MSNLSVQGEQSTTSEIAKLTEITNLGDPNADRIIFWDDSAGSLAYLSAGAGLSITGTTISSTGGSSIPVVDAGGDTTTWVLLSPDQTGDIGPATDGGLTYNATTNALSTTTFIGALTGNSSTTTALLNARTIGGVSFDGTANITVATATGGFTVSGGNLALGTNSLTLTGSIASTASRVTKGWFTDLEVSNAIVGSITGNSATVTTNANLTGVITSSGNATAIASQTGTGTKFVVDDTPTLVTPVLGVASATSINGLIITASTGTFTLTNAKTFAVAKSLTLDGTDGTTMTFPGTSATIARTDAGNTFTGVSTGSAWVLTSPTITTSLKPTSDDGAPLGDTTHNFSDLFLASGAVLNYANSNVVVTHSSGILTMGTGELRVTNIGTNTASVVSVGGTQSLTAKTLTDSTNNVTAKSVFSATTTVDVSAATAPTSGQVLTATGGTAATWQTLPAGGMTWSVITADQNAAVGNGYIANKGTLLTLTLPTTAAVGSLISIAGMNAGLWKIAQNASGQIHFGNANTTSGTGGSVASTNQYDVVHIVCSVANNEWVVLGAQGVITVT